MRQPSEENYNAQSVPTPPTMEDIASDKKEVPNKKRIEAPQGDILVPIELLDSPRSQISLNVPRKKIKANHRKPGSEDNHCRSNS